MFDISMGSLFPELTSSVEASPVSPTALPGSGKAATTSGTCGVSLPESLATLGPAGWWLKTSPASSQVPILLMAEERADSSSEFCETLPKWGSMRSGELSRLPPLGRTTSGTGCSSWPTPAARDYQAESMNAAAKRNTPTLPTAARLWPTPAAQDAKNSTLPPSLRGRSSVPGAVMRWATPQARDFRTGQGERWNNPARSRNLNDQAGGMLNPEFVAWLMGFPHGWLHFAHLGTPSSPSKRQSSEGRSGTRKRTAEPTE